MSEENQLNFPALSFVLLKGFGETPIPVQVSTDNRFLILSTHYNLSAIAAFPPLIDRFLGTQAELIKINKSVYLDLLLKIKSLEESDESENARIKTNDPLLLIRAFNLIVNQRNLRNVSDVVVSDEDLLLAIKHAVELDDLIKNAHHNIVETLKRIAG